MCRNKHSFFCIPLHDLPKSLTRRMRRIPTDSLIYPIVCLRAMLVTLQAHHYWIVTLHQRKPVSCFSPYLTGSVITIQCWQQPCVANEAGGSLRREGTGIFVHYLQLGLSSWPKVTPKQYEVFVLNNWKHKIGSCSLITQVKYLYMMYKWVSILSFRNDKKTVIDQHWKKVFSSS